MRMVMTFLVAASLATVAGSAHAAPPGLTQIRDGAFASAEGKALYTFDNDSTPGKSVCNGGCATIWPPLVAAADARASGDWSIINRDDGAKQWAYRGKPVYTFGRDIPGRPAMGESVSGWKLVR